MGGGRDLRAEVSPRGQSQNKEEARSHQGSPRVALQGAKRSPQCRKRQAAGPAPGSRRPPRTWTGWPHLSRPQPGDIWGYLGHQLASFFSFKLKKKKGTLLISIKVTLILTQRLGARGGPGAAVDGASSEGRQVMVNRVGLVPGSC